MDTVADYIVSHLISEENDPVIKEKMQTIQDIYVNAGYLPTLTDWEQMSDEERSYYYFR